MCRAPPPPGRICSLGRLSLAFRCFFSLLFDGKLPDDVLAKLNLVSRAAARSAPKADVPTVRVSDGALQVLGILQRDARLVDFLMEDISAYSDDQVGAAVRSLHEQSRKSLQQYFKLAPVIDGVEGAYTKIDDQSAVKLIGNVPADGKAAGGVLRHRGWKAEAVNLPNVPARTNLSILAPAELEIE